MSDIKLFRTQGDSVTELEGKTVALEKSLQILIENHLETLLGIKFLASEYSTGKTHAGRIDTLGIDENGCPCIIEYKRTSNENVINQGLFYLDWLMDHRAEFELMVIKQFGQEMAENIEWSNPRLLCIAGNFTKYDEHAVQQINRNIELLRYVRFGEEFLLFEMVHAVELNHLNTANKGPKISPTTEETEIEQNSERRVEENFERCSTELKDLYYELEAFLFSLGDDVQKKTLERYVAFKRIKNFACIEFQSVHNRIQFTLKVDPSKIDLEDGFSRDVSQIGHYGTGDLQVAIHNQADLKKALPLIEESYQAS